MCDDSIPAYAHCDEEGRRHSFGICFSVARAKEQMDFCASLLSFDRHRHEGEDFIRKLPSPALASGEHNEGVLRSLKRARIQKRCSSKKMADDEMDSS